MVFGGDIGLFFFLKLSFRCIYCSDPLSAEQRPVGVLPEEPSEERLRGCVSRQRWWTLHSGVSLTVSAVLFLCWTFGSALFTRKKPHSSKTFTCILGFVFQSYMTKLHTLFFHSSEFVPHHLSVFCFFLGGGLIYPVVLGVC